MKNSNVSIDAATTEMIKMVIDAYLDIDPREGLLRIGRIIEANNNVNPQENESNSSGRV